MLINNVCVYCSSSNALEEYFFTEARQLGQSITENNWGLVYGGTHIGLMGALANEALNLGGRVTGVIPEHIYNKGLAHTHCSELMIAPDMSQRKKTMIEISDAFIALPGGFGTLEEVMEVITLKQLQLINSPIVFLNTKGFYSKLDHFFDQIFHHKFTAEKFRELFFMADDIPSAIGYLKAYQPMQVTDKWSV